MVRVIAIFTPRASSSLSPLFSFEIGARLKGRRVQRQKSLVHPPALEWRNKTFVCFAHPLALARPSFGRRKGRKNHVTWRLKDLMAPGEKRGSLRGGFICSFFIAALNVVHFSLLPYQEGSAMELSTHAHVLDGVQCAAAAHNSSAGECNKVHCGRPQWA
jgi:hypothetical protein